MGRRRDAVMLITLALLLLGLIGLREHGTVSCARGLDALSGGPGQRPDPDQVAAALDAARGLPVAQRLDVLLEWIAKGSPLARAALERWLEEDFPPGALTARQRTRLEDVALGWPSEALRQAAAGVLLADAGGGAPGDPATVACQAVRGVAPPGALARLAAAAAHDPASARWLAGFGAAALPASLDLAVASKAGAADGLAVLLRARPELRQQAIPALIERWERDPASAGAAHALLLLIVEEDRGDRPGAWRTWWTRVRRTLERLTPSD